MSNNMTSMQRIRNEQGLSLAKLAAKSGVGANTIHRWERRLTKPHISTAEIVAEALGVSVWEYLDMKIPLKPCPFCGSRIAPEIILVSDLRYDKEGSPTYDFSSTHYGVVCNFKNGGCGTVGCIQGESKLAASIYWNRRSK